MSFLPSDPKDRKLYLLGLRIAGDFGAVIAVPIIVFVSIGQKLDSYYNIQPWCTVLAFILSAIISGAIIYKRAKSYGKIYADLIDEHKKQD